MQAEAGYLSLTGEPDGPPSRTGLSIVDLMTGRWAAVGCGVATPRLSRGLVSGCRACADPRTALRPSLAGAEPALPHPGRLYLYHVQQGEILADPVQMPGPAGMGERCALPQLQG